MVGSVAVLSDLHGVLPVLDAVLAEPDVCGADLIVVTGDHAAGPQPVAVLDRLAGLGDRVVLVRGNADRELVALAENPAAPPIARRRPRPDRPYGRPGGSWLLLRDGQVHLRHTVLDPGEIGRSLRSGSEYPGLEQWLHDYLDQPPSDAEAIAAFGPRDDRPAAPDQVSPQ